MGLRTASAKLCAAKAWRMSADVTGPRVSVASFLMLYGARVQPPIGIGLSDGGNGGDIAWTR
jgi:hypothetical protein